MSVAQTGGAVLSSLAENVGAAQRRASDPSTSVWVSASAGSGKTKVLADRVTRLLLDKVRPERILCLTFTRAAAAEMSIRLSQRLARWATCAPEALQAELTDLQNAPPDEEQTARARRLFAQVLACPGGMRIQTIHAFAQEVLRRFPLEAGLAPHFAMMEDADAKALWQDSVRDLLEELAEQPQSPAAQAFAVLVARLSEGTLQDLLRETMGHDHRLRRAMEREGGAEALIAAIADSLSLRPDDTPDLYLARACADEAFDGVALRRAAQLLLEKGGKTFVPRGWLMADWYAATPAERALSFAAYSRAFLTGEGDPFAKMGPKAVTDDNPWLDEVCRAEAQRLMAVAERMESARIVQETKALITLALRMRQAYSARKESLALLDYDDLIACTGRLLQKPDIAPWVLFKLDGGIDHILVDESQDTSPDQWRIIAALADAFFEGQGAWVERPRTLFVVGDEKQSIYSFLKADPQEFARMRRHFSQKIVQAQKPFEQVPMNVSFRSAPAILRAVDAVFADEKVRSGVSSDLVAHSAFRSEGAGRVEVWPLFTAPQEEKKTKARLKEPEDWEISLGYETAADPVADLARALALQIQSWVAQGFTVFDRDLKQTRPMHAGDVMVLVQKRKPFVDVFVRELKKVGVPVSGVDRMRLIDQLAVMDLMALLQFTLLPDDDLTLATVLRGPLIGASEEELMDLAIGREKGERLWDRLRDKAASNARYETWRAYLAALAALEGQVTPLALLMKLLALPCPADAQSGRRALAARLGPDAEDPIDELLGEAEAFSARHVPSLQSFLHWLMSAEFEIKRELEQAAGRVRITTVHTSKGLEAPIVILPDTTRTEDRTRLPKFLWDDSAEVPYYVAAAPLNGKLRLLREGHYARHVEESRRLLYVALTRAADRLYVCGFSKKEKKEADGDEKAEDKGNDKESWYNLIARGLAPWHQDDVALDPTCPVTPSVVMADYADLPCGASAPPPLPNPPRRGEGTCGSFETISGTQNSTMERRDTQLQQSLCCPLPLAGRVREGGGSPRDSATPFAPPPWLLSPPPPEPSPPRPLVPSRPSEEEPSSISPRDARFARGRIIHRLLQSLPDLDPTRWEDVAARFLANPQHALDPVAQREVGQEVLGLLRDSRFAPLFGPDSRAEQPIIGLSGERLIAGQVDRLALVGAEVWIVDYKTNRPPPADAAAIPPIYRGQMEAYRTVLGAIYPAKTIRCFLLWTYTASLMEV
ncbi:MAG: double-strand break repair helicase AddA [Alphaproteobacteria bacterium]|nr:double-strand break repair helicase AddA [Alphaproteobacteria bacterium]